MTTPVATYSISGSAGTPGATVTAGSQGATSDGSNNYTISGLANGTYTVTPSKSGCTFSPASALGDRRRRERDRKQLHNPASSYVTGTVIAVDGGQTAMLPMPASVSIE